MLPVAVQRDYAVQPLIHGVFEDGLQRSAVATIRFMPNDRNVITFSEGFCRSIGGSIVDHQDTIRVGDDLIQDFVDVRHLIENRQCG